MNIFFFGGSFDPPHKAHKLIYKHCINLCDKFILIPSKQSPLKNKPFSTNDDRLKMLELLIDKEDSSKVSIDDFELKNNSVSFTIDTIHYLRNKYIDSSLYMIIGYDQYKNFKKWKNYEEILNYVKVICFMRNSDSFDEIFPATIVDFDYDISSTLIRKTLKMKDNRPIKDLMDDKIYNYIIKKNIYKGFREC